MSMPAPPRLLGAARPPWRRRGSPPPPASDGAPARRLAAPGPPAPAEERSPLLWAYAAAGLLASLAVVAGSVAGGKAFISHLPGAWYFGTPDRPLDWMSARASHTRTAPILLVYAGLGVLAVLWWRLVRGLHRHPGRSTARAAGVVAAWTAPFLVAPPLFSQDLYSYAAQGEMVSRHIDPYAYGTGVLGVTHFTTLAGSFWATTPSPYGPTFLSLDGWATDLAGHQVLPDLLLLRLLAVAGVALMAAGLPTLARRVGADPAAALVLGVGSPLVLTSLVGGGHNDALMLGLLVAGLAVWVRFGPLPAIVLCALATGVKAPAALGVVLIGWNWAGPGAAVAARVRRTLVAGALALATLAAVSAATGLGWGWVLASTAPTKVHMASTTPTVAVGEGVAGVLHLMGLPVPSTWLVTAAGLAGLATAAGLTVWWVWRSPSSGPLRAMGLAFLAFVLLSPVVWPWYLTWGLVLLAPVATGTLRRAICWLSIIEVLTGATSAGWMLRTLAGAGPAAFLLVAVGTAAAVLLALGPTRPLWRRATDGDPATSTAPDHWPRRAGEVEVVPGRGWRTTS